MTPQEKAKDLIEKFKAQTQQFNKSKQCALIAVDEVMETLSPFMGDSNSRKYWQKVKEEINKL